MAFKFVILTCLVAATSAGIVPAAPLSYAAAPVAYATAPAYHSAGRLAYAPVAKVAAPVAYSAPVAYAAPIAKVAKVAVEEYDPHPVYSFSYGVQDGLTGDSKTQHESRDGDVVRGSYSVVDPDGSKRTVDYTADPHNGFNAVVHREPLGVKVAAVAPVAYAAAPVAKFAAPVSYAAAAPIVHAAAPVAKIGAPIAYAAAPYYHH